MSRFADPMEWLRQGYRAPPALHVTDTMVSRETLKPYLDELAHVRIPLIQRRDYITLDGEERGVETYRGASSIHVAWQAGSLRHTPQSLANLERLIDLLATLFERAEAERDGS